MLSICLKKIIGRYRPLQGSFYLENWPNFGRSPTNFPSFRKVSIYCTSDFHIRLLQIVFIQFQFNVFWCFLNFISDFNQLVRTIFVSDDFNTIVILLEWNKKKYVLRNIPVRYLNFNFLFSSNFWAISFLKIQPIKQKLIFLFQWPRFFLNQTDQCF